MMAERRPNMAAHGHSARRCFTTRRCPRLASSRARVAIAPSTPTGRRMRCRCNSAAPI
jgi:hypothetical protein